MEGGGEVLEVYTVIGIQMREEEGREGGGGVYTVTGIRMREEEGSKGGGER